MEQARIVLCLVCRSFSRSSKFQTSFLEPHSRQNLDRIHKEEEKISQTQAKWECRGQGSQKVYILAMHLRPSSLLSKIIVSIAPTPYLAIPFALPSSSSFCFWMHACI